MSEHTAAIKLLQKHFDIALQTPDGIKKLRELILTLAMQGKLVKQNPKDQPASELLKEIAHSTSLRERKKDKLPPIKPEEIPYEVPKGWEWVRVRSIGHDWGQKTPDTKFTYIDVGSINNLKGVISSDVQYLESFEAPSRARKIVKNGTVIYSTVRPYLLNIAIIDREFEYETIASTAFAIIHPYGGINNKFIYSYFRSPQFITFVESKMKGVAYPAINDGDFYQGLFPLPPLAEQKRIVAKIDQLMALCDKLEAQRNERNQKRLTVHTASMNRLLTATDKKSFDASWHFITKHFNQLYSVSENVSELKKAILQLAVMGKLVPQDPNDQPASELLKEIEEEKKRLMKEGKIRKQEPLPEIKPEEVPYQLPKGWEWVHCGDVLNFQTGKLDSNAASEHGQYPFFTCAKDPLKIDHYAFDFETVLLAGNNAAGKYNVKYFKGKFNAYQRTYIITLEHGNKRALTYPFLTHLLIKLLDELQARSVGTLTRFLTLGILQPLLIPIPPLAEQKRIVAKIDQLMALCDKLDNQISRATDKKAAILNAVMARV